MTDKQILKELKRIAKEHIDNKCECHILSDIREYYLGGEHTCSRECITVKLKDRFSIVHFSSFKPNEEPVFYHAYIDVLTLLIDEPMDLCESLDLSPDDAKYVFDYIMNYINESGIRVTRSLTMSKC